MSFHHSDEKLFVNDSFMAKADCLCEGRHSFSGFSADTLGGHRKYKTGRSRSFKPSKKFEAIRRTYLKKLVKALEENVSTTELRKVVEGAYLTAYAQGLLNSGLKTSRDVKSVIKNLSQAERQHISRTVSEEMRYLIRFDEALDEAGRDYGVIYERAVMYAKSLNGIYGSGRVNGLSPNTYITWTPGPDSVKEDRCESCKYLIENSPFLPSTLPTTPRAGDTRCLFNCKDILVVKEVTVADEQALRESSLTLEEHRSRLAYLQQNRKAKA